MTFEEVMAYDKRNYEVYCDIVKRYKDKGIIPFVGAGISVAAGFVTWDEFINQECLYCDLEYNNNDDPLDKASEIYKTIGAAQFRKDVVKTFGGEFTDADWVNVLNNVQNQAAGLLPKLFHEAIVTTNFDRLLEHLYPPAVVSHPGHDGQLNRALLMGKAMIFKLHGCVSDPEEIILTRESYKKVYEASKNKEALRALEKILTNQTVLFLGCSLNKCDYTVKHWTKMTAHPKGKGIEHFAVIGCKREERQLKRRDLGDMNIFPILYDENNHDAVRVVLNQLYIDTNGGKPLHNLPPQNKYFSGRASQLESINNLFKESSHCLVNICQTVSGLGGIGKTQLAIEYAYRYCTDFKSCIWFINAETKTTAQNYFVDFANRFNIKLPKESTPEELQGAIKIWLNENKEWLLIFDNLESADTIKPYLPDNIIGRIIITTRSTRIDFGSQIVLGVFDMDEAAMFLKKRLSNNEKLNMEFYNNNDNDFDDQAPELITRLGFLPLALEQAAAYIREVKCTITAYLKRLEESGLLAFEEKYAAPEYYEKANEFEKIVTATWNISFKAIACEGARQLLNLCAYMAPDKIPVAFFAEMREKLPSPIKEDMAEGLTRDRIVTELRVYSLTSGDADYINVHRLVQEVVRKSHNAVGYDE